jgi:phytoene/squalene synthetase
LQVRKKVVAFETVSNVHPYAHDLVSRLIARAFWVQSGLRFESTKSDAYSGSGTVPDADPMERMHHLRDSVESLYNNDNPDALWQKDGNLRLIHLVMKSHELSRKFLDRIIEARERDINVKQYATMQSLVEHTELSCGSLLHLALQSAGVDQSDSEHVIYKAACEIGRAHGLTNALRTSIPVASFGKIIIPADLCTKYGVKSPRYLLSALGQGDEECRGHLKSAVRDIASTARTHLNNARILRDSVSSSTHGDRALSALIAGVASETFLNRLENHDFDLTDKNLRQVGIVEHAICAGRILLASKNKTY